MENKSHAFIAGLFTVCLVAVALFIVWYLNVDKTVRLPYMISTDQCHSRTEAAGHSPLSRNGCRAGDQYLGSIPARRGKSSIHFEVKEDTPMTKSTYATLTYQGVTGIASVELTDSGTNMAKLETSPENPAEIPMRPESVVGTAGLRGLHSLEEVQNVTSRLSYIFNKENSQDTDRVARKYLGHAARSWEKVPNQL